MVSQDPRNLTGTRSAHGRRVMPAASLPTHLFAHMLSRAERGGGPKKEVEERAGNIDGLRSARREWVAGISEDGMRREKSSPSPARSLRAVERPSAHKHAENNRDEVGPKTESDEKDDQLPSPTPTKTYQISAHRTNEEVFELVNEGIAYARECISNGTVPHTHLHFAFPRVQSLAIALKLLQDAATMGIVTPSWATSKLVCYEIAFRPPPVYGYPFAAIDPHWWVGKSAGEIKAGPMASKEEVKAATGGVRRKEARRSAAAGRGSAVQSRIQNKLEEGLRRQEEGLRIYDDDGRDAVEDAPGIAD